jgi:hypothetical protein
MPRISLPPRNNREIFSISDTEYRKINALPAAFRTTAGKVFSLPERLAGSRQGNLR